MAIPGQAEPASALVTKVGLFASSYAPLFGMLALRFEETWLRVGLGLAFVVFFAYTIRIAIFVPKHVGASPHTVQAISNEGGQVAGYLATYLLPFLVVPSPSATDLLAYAAFLIIAGVVAVQSDLTHINPTLYLLGYRLIGIKTVEGFDGYAIVRSPLEVNGVLRANHLGEHILVEVKRATS